MSRHLSMMSDTALYSWEEGAFKSFYFISDWAYQGLCTRLSTQAYEIGCRFIMVACRLMVSRTFQPNFYCPYLQLFIVAFAFRVMSAHIISLLESPFYFYLLKSSFIFKIVFCNQFIYKLPFLPISLTFSIIYLNLNKILLLIHGFGYSRIIFLHLVHIENQIIKLADQLFTK